MGIYFEEDEVFASYFFSLNAFYNSPHLFFNEEYLGVSYIIIYLQHHFPSFNFFGGYKLLSLVIVFSLLAL
jgi:hypothetical protein